MIDQRQATGAGGCEALLVEPTVEGLAGGLRECLDRLDEMPDWGKRNRQWAAQFTWKRMVEQYLNPYRECLMQAVTQERSEQNAR